MRDKSIKLITTFLVLLFLSSIFNFPTTDIKKTENFPINIKENKPKTSKFWDLTGNIIIINDTDPNYNWSKTASENEWCWGSGSWSDPYIIENVTINGQGLGNCIEIRNSNAYFLIRNNTFYNYVSSYSKAGIKLDNVDNGKIINNNCSNINAGNGIYLWDSNNNTLSGNTGNNNSHGIFLNFSVNNTLSGNTASNNNGAGIYLHHSNNNTLSGNTASNNNGAGISLIWNSNNNTLSGNTANNNNYGIYLSSNSNNTLYGNLMNFCGIYLSGSLVEMASHSIDDTNLINNRPVYYYANETGLGSNNFTNAGQIILINCCNSIISGLNLSCGSTGIRLYYSNNNTLSGNTASYNHYRGIHLSDSYNNTLSGNTANNNMYGMLLFSSDNNMLSGNTANNNNYGIRLLDSYNNTLSGNTANNNMYGISIRESNNNTFSGNTANNNMYGIVLYSSSNNTLSGNTANNNYYGIFLDISSNNNTLSGNTANNNNYGIFLHRNINNRLSGNLMNFCGIYLSDSLVEMASHSIDDTNLVNNKPVYYYVNETCLGSSNFTDAGQIILINCNNSIISGLNLSYGTTGIHLYYSNNNTLSGNTISNNIYYGIHLSDSNNNTLSRNTGNNNMYAISLSSSDNNMLSGNRAYSNNIGGIALGFSNNNTLLGNIVDTNDDYGIYLGCSNNNTLSGNTANNNHYGIYLWDSNSNTLSGNTASNNTNSGIYLDRSNSNNTFSGNTANNNYYGILLSSSDTNRFSGNTIRDNNYYGTYIYGGIKSTQNLFFDNSFSNNRINAYDDGIDNYWNNSVIGNYWDDYNGEDSNNDGIGDTPYNISGSVNSQDNYPIWWDFIDIFINTPNPNEFFGTIAPNFTISIDKGLARTTWYTIDNGLTNVTFTGLTGTINQSLWDALPEGNVVIKFYANNTLGRIGFAEVTIVKKTSALGIPGYDLLFLLGIISTVAVIIIKKRVNHLN